MKKMICSVCGSSSIRKTNDNFVCGECGVEYSLEEARKLLQEVAEVAEPASSVSTPINTTESKDQLLKLKYDLLCWHKFYEKCHEVENSFYIVDEERETSRDITERNLNWDYASYFEKNFDKPLFERYVSEHPELKEEYKKYTEEIYAQNRQKNERVANINHNRHKKFWLVYAIVTIIMTLLSVASFGSDPIFITMWFLVAIVMPALIFVPAAFIFYHYGDIPPYHEQCRPYNDFVADQRKSSGYQSFYKSACAAFTARAQQDAETLVNYVPELKQIKEQLTVNCPVPRSYSDEEHINALLALVIDGRAETLKEAINLYETEQYRIAVTSSLASMNDNMILLNGQIQSLSKDINSKLGSLVAQNRMITESIARIQVSTQILALDAILS